MCDITKLNLIDVISALKNKDFSVVELTKKYIKNIEDNKNLNAFISTTFDLAIDNAKKSDERISNGNARKLEGIPLGIKDLFCTKGIKTTAGSKMLENFIPPYESTVTQKLWDEGAIMLGKTNMDEFAMGSSNITSHFGPAINPYKRNGDNTDLVPGGSSGGSAIVVSANLSLAATGSDTGGSIRQPASFTNIVGIKPTYGRCSRYGMIAFASSLDQAGFFAKTVKDSAYLMNIICGYDEKDSTSIDRSVPDFANLLNPDIKGKKIGIPKEYRDGISSEISDFWNGSAKLLQENGAEIIDISLPHTKYAPSVYYIIASAECSSNLSRYDGVRYGHRTKKKNLSLDEMYEETRSEGFGDEVKRRILTGTYVLSAGYYDAYYKKALQVRNLILQDFKNAFKKVDIILTPTTPKSAFPINSSIEESNNDPISMYLNDIFTIPASLAGMPAMSVPFGFDNDGLPRGIQLIADHFNEQNLFDIGSNIII